MKRRLGSGRISPPAGFGKVCNVLHTLFWVPLKCLKAVVFHGVLDFVNFWLGSGAGGAEKYSRQWTGHQFLCQRNARRRRYLVPL